MQSIKPLMNWSGQLSHDALVKRGFVEVNRHINPMMLEGVVAQREGYHDEDVKKQWELYSHITNEDAALVFDMILII